MVARNDITGDAIQTRTVSETYLNNYDAIFPENFSSLETSDGQVKQRCSRRCWMEVVDNKFICNKPNCTGIK